MDDKKTYDLLELLGSKERDFLIRNNGDQVKISSLKGKKIVGIYPYRIFYCKAATLLLIELYHKIASSKGNDFEMVMVYSHTNGSVPGGSTFNAYFAEMPWLAVPHADSKAVEDKLAIYLLRGWDVMILDKRGKVLLKSAKMSIERFGAEAYPFSAGRIGMLQNKYKLGSVDQSIEFLVGDSVITAASPDQSVPVSQLVGKTVLLYLWDIDHQHDEFTELLVRVYNKLQGEKVEVVLVPYYSGTHQDFYKTIETMPWLALPLRDQRAIKLWNYFERKTPSTNPPWVVIIGPNGKTLNVNGYKLIKHYGYDAFPFTRQKRKFLDRMAQTQPWTLEYLLAFHDLDFLITKDGSKVPVAQFVGKTVMLYFFVLRSKLQRRILESWREIREKNEEFVVIIVDIPEEDREQMDDWMLALPSTDVRLDRLVKMFKLPDIRCSMGIVLDPSCQILTKDGVILMDLYGGDAYPFTTDHLKRVEQKTYEITSIWPEKIFNPQIHKHEIHRVCCQTTLCYGCVCSRSIWNYECFLCKCFNLHNDFDYGGFGDYKPDGRPLLQAITTSTSPSSSSSNLEGKKEEIEE